MISVAKKRWFWKKKVILEKVILEKGDFNWYSLGDDSWALWNWWDMALAPGMLVSEGTCTVVIAEVCCMSADCCCDLVIIFHVVSCLFVSDIMLCFQNTGINTQLITVIRYDTTHADYQTTKCSACLQLFVRKQLM